MLFTINLLYNNALFKHSFNVVPDNDALYDKTLFNNALYEHSLYNIVLDNGALHDERFLITL